MKTGAARESQATTSGAARRISRGVALAAPGHGMPAVALGLSSGGIGAAIGTTAAPHVNTTGLPDQLKSGVETLSGISLDDVRVHYNSPRPAQLQAFATTEGAEIHVGPGQERHLPHEAWHVVQQKQGRVRQTLQMKGVAINNDDTLEREADVMGAAAARGGGTAPGRADAALGADAAASATPVVQRRLKTQLAGAGITKANDLLQIASPRIRNKDQPSDGVKGLIASSETFYLPDTLDVDLAAPQIRVLEEKKYLLGEQHYSQAWEKRTAPWSYIPKMSEAHSAIHSEDPQASEALLKAQPPPATLPLEESLTKAVSNALYLQHTMNDYSKISASYLERAPKLKEAALRQRAERTFWLSIQALYNPMRYVEADLAELEQVAGIKEFTRFAGVAKTKWAVLLSKFAQIIQKRDSGPGLGSAQAPLWLSEEKFLGAFGASFGPTSIALIQSELKNYIDDILAVMAARQIMKPSGQFVTDARALGTAGSPQSYKWAAAVDPERERFMRARIAGAPAPLLVQLGDAHREHLEQAGLPAGTVAVARCAPASDAGTARDPIVTLTTRSITSTNWLAWSVLAAAVAIGAALWLRSGKSTRT